MTDPQLQAIRKLTRVTLPVNDEYLFRLGVALYGFAWVTNFMVEVISHLDPCADRQTNSEQMAGDILKDFQSARKKWTGAPIKKLALTAEKEFQSLNTDRSHFVHAYPITGVSGAQILHRRVDKKHKDFEITDAFLDDFISRLTRVSDALYAIRDAVA